MSQRNSQTDQDQEFVKWWRRGNSLFSISWLQSWLKQQRTWRRGHRGRWMIMENHLFDTGLFSDHLLTATMSHSFSSSLDSLNDFCQRALVWYLWKNGSFIHRVLRPTAFKRVAEYLLSRSVFRRDLGVIRCCSHIILFNSFYVASLFKEAWQNQEDKPQIMEMYGKIMNILLCIKAENIFFPFL